MRTVRKSRACTRIGGLFSPDPSRPSPQPSPARERGPGAVGETGLALLPDRCNMVGYGSSPPSPAEPRPVLLRRRRDVPQEAAPHRLLGAEAAGPGDALDRLRRLGERAPGRLH